MLRSISCTGFSPSLIGFPKTIPLSVLNQFCGPNPDMHARRFGLFPFRSPLLWKSIFLSLPPVTQMFQFTGFPSHILYIHIWMTGVRPAGFPHSEIYGSQDICSSPQLIAAYHVFHRLLVPRHPPCALCCLTFFTSQRGNKGLLLHMFPYVVCFSRMSYLLYSSLHSFLSRVEYLRLRYISLSKNIFFVFCMRFSRYMLQRVFFAMETERFELLTPCLQGRCSPN